FSADQCRQPGECIDAFLHKPVQQSVLFETILHCFGVEAHQAAPNEAKPGEERPPADLRGARVLLVEDNELNLQVASEILSAEGVQLITARNGREAVDTFARDPDFDAILMDVQMPVLDGYRATRELRENPACKNVPIIAMTATAMNDDIAAALEAGMDDHVSKPIHPEHLFHTLAGFIKLGRGARPTGPASGEKRATNIESDGVSDVPGISLSDALRRLQGNREILDSLLREFSRDYEDFAQEIRRAIQNKDLETAVNHCHTLRGVAANLSMSALAQRAEDLETELRANPPESEGSAVVEEIFERLQSSLREVIASVQGMPAAIAEADPNAKRPAEAAPPTGAAPPLDSGVDFSRLLQLAKNFDTEALKELERIRDDFLRRNWMSEYEDLQRRLQQYDFTGAGALLRRLVGKT
ncbi:MAG: response regulator, partial [Leptospirales bacterium]